MLEPKQQAHIDLLVERYPKWMCADRVLKMHILCLLIVMVPVEKLLVRNGGSAADSEHILLGN